MRQLIMWNNFFTLFNKRQNFLTANSKSYCYIIIIIIKSGELKISVNNIFYLWNMNLKFWQILTTRRHNKIKYEHSIDAIPNAWEEFFWIIQCDFLKAESFILVALWICYGRNSSASASGGFNQARLQGI